MKQQFHILNGDAFKEQFPETLPGEIIVFRECLVDGNVEGESLESFFANRATFIRQYYGGHPEEDYYQKVVSEFQKIIDLPSGAEINLWFEDDLFCQVNFWFVMSLLKEYQPKNPVFLIRPEIHTELGFAGLTTSELISGYENRLHLTEIDELSMLWQLYQGGDTSNLVRIAKDLQNKYPFILPAVIAHVDRLPKGEDKGRPYNSLVNIMRELQTDKFGEVFREFNKRESIYGFGDLQVKRLYDQVKGDQ